MELAAVTPELSSSLALSRTVTRFCVQEAPELSLTLLLDREPIEAVQGSAGEAESEILIGAHDLLSFVRGELQLPMAIAKGRVSYTGPVRKFLRAAPILRRAARVQAAGDGAR